jgi:hypothetical protein
MVEKVNSGGSELVDARRQHPSLPTRLIDIGTGEDIQPQICLTAGWTDAPAYATLNYRRRAEEYLRLTSRNAEQFMESIPLYALSTPAQDALATARRLGIRYVWIDWLCVVQDEVDDMDLEWENVDNYDSNSAVSTLDSMDMPTSGVFETLGDVITTSEDSPRRITMVNNERMGRSPVHFGSSAGSDPRHS